MSRPALWTLFAGAVITVVGVLIQAFAIAAYERGAGQGALDLHGANSITVHVGQLLIVIGAIWAWRRDVRAIALAIGFLVLSFLQLALLGDTDKAGGWVNGLHGLLAIVVLLAAVAYGQIAYKRLSEGSSGAVAS
jgi:hypothetical protein